MIESFLIDIVAGAVLTVCTWLLFKVAAPYYRAWRHEAPPLAGAWLFFDSLPDTAVSVGSANFKQTGELVEAAVTRTTSRNGKQISRSFTYRGRVRHGQVLLNFEQVNVQGYISGSLVLRISGDLKSMAGFTVYLDRDANMIVSFPICFRRQ